LFGEFVVVGELHKTSCEREGGWAHAIGDHEDEVLFGWVVDCGEEGEGENEDEGAEEGEEKGENGATRGETTEPVFVLSRGGGGEGGEGLGQVFILLE
jgi:hypothetical protein